mmetsp:Transcript_14071/g.16230  ORF Transcript_14071/g.16230 Transcript_14071/m.16230 type:complete len:123 (-) Transcript_14071:130-498(-)
MKYISAYLLLALSGKEQPSAADVEAVLSSVGANVNKADLEKVVDSLKGKKLHEVITEGSKKLSTMSFGGGSGGSGAAETKKDDKPAAKKDDKPAAKKEEPKKEEEKPEEDMDLGGGMFGDDF